MDGTHLVRELLDELLQDVCSDGEWELIRKIPNGVASPNLVGPAFDVCELIASKFPSRVLTNYCVMEGGAEVLQMKCVKQQASGYCGHYAIFFSLCCLEACFSPRIDEAIGYLGQITSCVAYWRRYWVSVAELLKRVREGGGGLWWPWTSEHVLAGDLERSYVAHLLKADPHLLSVGGCDSIVVMHFAYGCIQNTVLEVCEIQHKIELFRTSSGPAWLVFMLGVTNHWVTVLAFRVPDAGREKRGLVYLDSNNVPVLTAGNSDIVQIVKKKESERLRRKGRGYSEWKRGVMYQAFVDQRDVVQLVVEVLYGSKNLCTEVLTTHFTRLLGSYREHVDQPLGDKADRGMYTAFLVHWLEHHYRPQTLRDTHLHALRQCGTEFLQHTTRVQVESWVHHCQDLCVSGIDIVDLFLAVLNNLDSVLKLS